MPYKRVISPTMPCKRPVLFAVICAGMLCLLGISYEYDPIREAFGSVTSGSPQVSLVGQDISGRPLDHRDIWMFMQRGHESEERRRGGGGGGGGDGKAVVQEKYRDTSRRDVSPVRNVLKNDSSSGDEGQQEVKDTEIPRTKPRPDCLKQVHIWGNEDRLDGIQFCPGLACGINLVINTNYQTLKTSDAVLLLHRTQWDWSEMVGKKPKGQKWIFYSQESPLNTRKDIVPPKEHYHDVYDYVMSYRFRESQLYGRFGYYDTSKPSVDLKETRNWARGRKRQVAWLASNCNSSWLHWNRTGFVKELSGLLDVGMYGRCGDHTACPARAKDRQTCSGVLRQFKFYLALENCACRDYITEKLWNNAYLLDLVPIVFGPPRSDYEAVAPPNSFIHVQDFETLQDLADYVNLLDKNDHLYNKYFEWKKLGFVTTTTESWLLEPEQMCQVVKRLLTDEKAERDGTFKRPASPNWKAWWTDSCQNIPEFPIKIHR